MDQTALAERMLVGDWRPDLITELMQFLAPEVVKRMTHPDITRNPQKSTSTQLNVLYSGAPSATSGDLDLSPIVTPELWPLRQRGNLYTIGLRDSFMRLDWYEGRGVTYRVVSPSYVMAWADAKRPDVPVMLRELRPRVKPGTQDAVWTIDTWDVRNPTAPVFKIEAQTRDGWVEVTGQYVSTPGYPYVRKDGSPIFPWVMYHPEITDRLWHWGDRNELIDGTLKVGCLWTMWIHGVRDCAHPQRTGLDVEAPQAVSTGGPNPIDRIALDQSSILLMRSVTGRNGSLSTLAPAMDPKAAAEAIMQYEAGLAQSAGINAADIQSGTTGMSGYAIVVSRDGLRRAWAAQKPAAEYGDKMLLATAAALSNAYGTTTLPESPDSYAIEYVDISRTPDDVIKDLDEGKRLAEAGAIGPVDVVVRAFPGITEAQAIARMESIANQKVIAAKIEADLAGALAAVGAPAAPPPAPPTGA